MSKREGRSFWDDIKQSGKKPFETWKKKPKKPSPEQRGVSSTSGTVEPGVAGCSGASQQAHHDQVDLPQAKNLEPVASSVSPGGNLEPVASTVSPGWNLEPVASTVSPGGNPEPVAATVSPGGNLEPVSEALVEHGKEARPSGGYWVNLRITEFPFRSAMVVGALAGGAMAGGGVAVGGMAVGGIVGGALTVLLNKNLGLVEIAIRAALVKLGCQVWRIKPCSILVDLHCNTKESFLSFMEDFETGKVKQRLEEEFKKVGYEGELEVAITNYQEVHEKLDQIRKLEQEKIKVVEGETSATVAVSKYNIKMLAGNSAVIGDNNTATFGPASTDEEHASTSAASPTGQETLLEMTAHQSFASVVPTSPASSTEQETLSDVKEKDASTSPVSPTEQETLSGYGLPLGRSIKFGKQERPSDWKEEEYTIPIPVSLPEQEPLSSISTSFNSINSEIKVPEQLYCKLSDQLSDLFPVVPIVLLFLLLVPMIDVQTITP